MQRRHFSPRLSAALAEAITRAAQSVRPPQHAGNHPPRAPLRGPATIGQEGRPTMFHAISRWTMLLAALLGVSAAASGAQSQAQLRALVSWGYDGDFEVSATPTTGTYSAVSAGGFHSV